MGAWICRFAWAKTETRILLQGLDAAGKTTALYRLKLGEVVTTIPTIGFNVETIDYKNLRLTAWDVGGRDKIRPLYRHYYPNTDAIIFVVDSNDKERLPEVKEELHRTMQEDELRDAILLVLANKQDLPGALTCEQIVMELGLLSLRSHKWNIQPTCATSGEGLSDSLEWLANQISFKKTGKFIKEPILDTVEKTTQNKWTEKLFTMLKYFNFGKTESVAIGAS